MEKSTRHTGRKLAQVQPELYILALPSRWAVSSDPVRWIWTPTRQILKTNYCSWGLKEIKMDFCIHESNKWIHVVVFLTKPYSMSPFGTPVMKSATRTASSNRLEMSTDDWNNVCTFLGPAPPHPLLPRFQNCRHTQSYVWRLSAFQQSLHPCVFSDSTPST